MFFFSYSFPLHVANGIVQWEAELTIMILGYTASNGGNFEIVARLKEKKSRKKLKIEL